VKTVALIQQTSILTYEVFDFAALRGGVWCLACFVGGEGGQTQLSPLELTHYSIVFSPFRHVWLYYGVDRDGEESELEGGMA